MNQINYQLEMAWRNQTTLPAGLWIGSTTELLGFSSGLHLHIEGKYSTILEFNDDEGPRPTQDEVMRWLRRSN